MTYSIRNYACADDEVGETEDVGRERDNGGTENGGRKDGREEERREGGR